MTGKQPQLRVAVAVTAFGRPEMLGQTLRTLCGADIDKHLRGNPGRRARFDLDVVEGGSGDRDTEVMVEQFRGYVFPSKTTTGAAMQAAIDLALQHKPDIVILSADDITYPHDWFSRLVYFIKYADPDVKLFSALMEPLYPWNKVDGRIDQGAPGHVQQALTRQSLPGSSWAFRAHDWPIIGPIADKTGGEDLEICKKLRTNGYRMAALDIATHDGEKKSAWGNESWRIAKPLNTAEWGITPGRIVDIPRN